MATTFTVLNRTDLAAEPVPATVVSLTSDRPSPWPVVIAVALVAACVYLAANALPHPSFPTADTTTPVEGLTIFAVFFVGAQALERLLEPIALVLGLGAKEKDDAAATAKNVLELAEEPTVRNVMPALLAAADAKAANERKTAERSILFWGLASGIAALASGAFGFYFLSTVGIPVPALWLEILGTALIIGAGTKPLHDLISLIEKKKQAAAVGIPL